MKYLSGDALLETLPLILAGPILRRTQANAVTVWVALKQPCQVDLQVLNTQNDGEQTGRCILEGHQKTAYIGENLHVVAITARSLTGEMLESDQLYAYSLNFTADKHYTLTAALSHPRHEAQSIDTESISYFAHQKPTFTLPPTTLDHLKIVHGSCRKPHGRGFDALPILDCLLEANARHPQARPHQLFMTGDQIYGDDVADPLLWLATALGDRLLGWEEKLPSASDKRSAQPKELAAGNRTQVATQRAGLTAGLTGKEERTTSHLFGFGEYCAVYLLAYSPACWPADLPAGREVTQGRKTIRRWDNDKRNMEQFLYSLWKVRRLLANIPTYTIFDDHDVSDDWNLNQAWCLRVLGKPLGRRTVQNAMLGYAIFQAWGNTPQQFEAGTSGAALLLATREWSSSGGKNSKAEHAIATYLGLPPAHPHTGLPEFTQDKDVWIFQRSKKALTWHYTVRSACHEVIVLDTRTWRGYPIDGKNIDPPMLLSPTAFQQQVAVPLAQPHPPSPTAYGTFLIAPTNVFGMRVLDWIQQWHLNRSKVFSADVGDSWNFHDQALATLLTILFQYRTNIVILSGDIHYSSAIHVDYRNLKSGDRATLTQFTSSAMKNEELLTQILHTRLKDWLLPEKPRQWMGWSSPPDMKELARKTRLTAASKSHESADWYCRMQWLRRQRAQTVDITSSLPALIPPKARRSQAKVPLSITDHLKFWKARWFQAGQEVVGVNNIALVHFHPTHHSVSNSVEDTMEKNTDSRNSRSEASSSQQSISVRQEHYWFSSWLPIRVVRSRFE